MDGGALPRQPPSRTTARALFGPHRDGHRIHQDLSLSDTAFFQMGPKKKTLAILGSTEVSRLLVPAAARASRIRSSLRDEQARKRQKLLVDQQIFAGVS